MATIMSADSEALRNLGNQVIENANEYASEVKKIYSSIENLSTGWSGVDNQKYVSEVNSNKEMIDALGKSIEAYGRFLVDTASTTERTINKIVDSASRI